MGRLDSAGIALERGVRGSEQEHVRPGDRESDAVPVDRDRQRGIPPAVSLEDEVRTPAQGHGRARPRILEPPDRVDPRPGRVDDGTRADIQRLVRENVAYLSDRPALETDQLDPVQHDRAGVGGAAEIRQTQPRIVGLRVRIETGGAEAVQPQRGDELRGGRGRDHAAALGDSPRQAGVRPESAADRDPSVRAAPVDREHEVERRERDEERRTG